MRVGDPRFVLIVAAVLWLPGCAGNPVPREWRQPATVAQRSPRGGWIHIDTLKASDGRSQASPPVEGELIAIDQSIHVLTAAGLQSVPMASVRRVTLVGYGTRAGALAGWAVGGGISTLSHGAFLIFTAPMWAITGVVAARAEAGAGVLHEVARSFARFPQGLPSGVDPESLGTLRAVVQPPGGR